MKVLYATPSSFRTVNAGALRNVTIANALASRGHPVTILSGDDYRDVPHPEWKRLVHPGVEVLHAGQLRRGTFSSILRFVVGVKFDEHLSREGYSHLIAYNPGPLSFVRSRRFARLSQMQFVVDVSEWLSARDLPGGIISPYAWLYDCYMRRLPRYVETALAISRPMAGHLSSGGARCLVVPPLSDAAETVGGEGIRPHSERQRIVVSGTGMGRDGKDSLTLRLLADAATRAPGMLQRFDFDVVGALDGTALEAIGTIRTVASVSEHGSVPWSTSVQLLSHANWLLLVRDPSSRRNTMGFPSKLIESLAVGTPVITNVCGSVEEFVVDGWNGLMIPGPSVEELISALERASRTILSPGRHTLLKSSSWGELISDFLDLRRDGNDGE